MAISSYISHLDNFGYIISKTYALTCNNNVVYMIEIWKLLVIIVILIKLLSKLEFLRSFIVIVLVINGKVNNFS